MKQKTIKPPLFRITKEVWESVDIDTIADTSAAMKDVGIFKPPFRHFCIETHASLGVGKWQDRAKEADIARFTGDGTWLIEIKYVDEIDSEYYDFYVWLTPRGETKIYMNDLLDDDEAHEYITNLVKLVQASLIVFLATKNADKETKTNDPRSKTHREREDAKKYTTTTTIKIGKVTETMEGHGNNGRGVRPHLRRGHVRQQRFGEGRSQIKKVFIEPCFVNADKDWVDLSKDYRVVA